MTVSRIEPLPELREWIEEGQEIAPACPEDWGALRVKPNTVELWSEAADRIHERRLFQRDGERWSVSLLSP